MNLKSVARPVLAQRCGVADAYLYQILTGRREASAELCVLIERESGKEITRQELRPKDWARIWPELADQAGEAA